MCWPGDCDSDPKNLGRILDRQKIDVVTLISRSWGHQQTMNFHCFKHFSSVSPAAGHYVITKSLRSVFLAIMGLLPRKAFWWWSLWIKTKQANLVPKILPKKHNYCLILFGILHIYKIAFQLWWHLGRPARCRGWASCNLVQSQMKKRCFVRVSTCKVWTLYMHCFKKFQSIHPETSIYIYITM